MRLLSAILTLLLSFQQAKPQEFVVRTLPTQHQLPSAAIHCLHQDSQGYLWYGTERAGVCRDNGYQVDVFRPSQQSKRTESNQINCIGETTKGDILLGTGAGLFRIDKGNYQIHPEKPQGEKIHALLTDSQGRVWIGLEGRVRLLGGKEEVCTSDGKPHPVSGLYEDHQGTIFALEWQGSLLRWNYAEARFVPLAIPEHVKPVAMTEDREHHCYWVLTSNEGIVRMTIKGDSCQVTLQPATLGDGAHRRGLSLLRDSKHGLLWATTMDNLYAYRVEADASLQPFPLHDIAGEDKKVLDQLLESRSGDIYVAGFMPQTIVLTENDNKAERLAVEPIRDLSGYPLHADRSVREGDHLWIWHRRVGLVLYNRKTQQLTLAPWKVNPWFIPSRSTKRGVWASRKHILYHIWHEDGQIQREEQCQMPDSAELRTIHDDGAGTLHIATPRHLYRYSVVGHGLQPIATLSETPTSLTLADGHLCWIADGHVFHLPPSSQKSHKPTHPQKIDSIERATALADGADGTLWISTQNGQVFQLQLATGTLTEAYYMQSEHAAPLLDIAVDGMGHVWTLSDQQVREYSPTTRAFRTIRNNSPQIDVAQFSSIDVEDASHLTINAAGALILVQSSVMLNQPATTAQPWLSAYQIDEKTYYTPSHDGEIILRPDDVELTLHLTTFDPMAAHQITFAYQLEGISRHWVQTPVGSNIIHFTKLPTGKYILYAKATDRYGRWGTPVPLLTLRILPPWHQTWWARLTFLLFLLLLGVGVWKLENRIRLLHKLIRRRESVRLDEIQLKREDITQNRIDDEFLHKAVLAVETHLADPEFNVEALADALCMSRANLHRRMKAQTDLSPTDFIRDIRLKKAAQLLIAQPDATITDVATKVGFATPKYFSRLFRDKFGVSPKEYTAENPSANLSAVNEN